MLAAIAIASCSGQNASVDGLNQRARQDFVDYDFVAARDAFAEALKQDPHNAEAAYGYARSLGVLNIFEDAVPAFELALNLAPESPRAHEEFLSVLKQGGIYRGRRDWLDRAIEAGREAILAFPDRVRPYEIVEQAVGKLNESDQWLPMLSALETRLEGSAVFRIHLLKARLQVARSSGDEESLAAIHAELQKALAAAVAAEEDANERGAKPDAGRRYFLALGYKELGDSDAQLAWLARLEETGGGREMGARMAHSDVHYENYFSQPSEAPLEEKLEVFDRWTQRFQPAWETDFFSFYEVPLSLETDQLVEEAFRQRDEGGRPSGLILDRIEELSAVLVRLDTGGGAARYNRVARVLLSLGERHGVALEFADDALAALKEERPGLIYPGEQADQYEQKREQWIATFDYLRGLALVGMDRGAEAEQAFRKAIDTRASSERLASLGELLASLGSNEEAYEMLISALAHSAEDDRLKTEAGRIRSVAVEVAARTGRDEATLDAALEDARAEVTRSARQSLVDNRLEREAPDFSLADTEGNHWRLSDHRGKVVLLNYWATWCGPCRREFPHYRDLVDSYASEDDVVFLAITTDTDHSETRDFLEENDYRFTVLFDEGSATDFHVTGVPTHFILGPAGRIQYTSLGFPGAARYDEEMRWRIEALRRE